MIINEKPGGKKNNSAGREGGGAPEKPLVLLGIGNARIEEWIKVFFLEQASITVSPADSQALREKISGISPDILVLMRQNSMGGIPDAGSLAVSAAQHVPAVLFIIGELDDEGKDLFDQARDAGVQNIITCERGGQIYGDELVYSLTGLIRKINGPAGRKEREEGSPDSLLNGEAGKTINSLFQSAGSIGRAIIKSAGTVSEKAKTKSSPKKTLTRINRSKGIALENAGGLSASLSQMSPTSIVPGGILAVVTPWRPNLAGRLAAQAVKMFGEVNGGEVAYIGASGSSTGALWLDVPEDELIMSDWRVPGSSCPITRGNIKIFAVDPVKDLRPGGDEELMAVLHNVRKTSTYTVVDFAGDMAMARKAVLQGRTVLLVVAPGNDPVELRVSTLWIRNIMDGCRNVVTGIDIRGVLPEIPEDLNPKVIVRNNPADALNIALKKQNDNVFVWV